MDFDAYFFDFDGTIGATETDIRSAWLAAIRKLGLSEEHFAARFHVGPPIADTSRMLYPEMPPEKREILQEAYKSFYDDGDRYQAVPYPGVMDMLRKVHSAGKKIYIVTNKRMKPLKKLVNLFDLGPLCHGLFVPDLLDAVHHLKKDALLALAVRISGVSPDRALMVGDTELDISCGRACKIKTCGVTWGYGDIDSLKRSAPDFLISDPADLP